MLFFGDESLFESQGIHSAIMSLPAHGNVGQLAMDCILASLARQGKLRKIGMLETDLVLPMVGYDSLGDSAAQLCFPIEVYLSDNVVLVHTRTPHVPSKGQVLAAEILTWLQAHEISLAIFLTSANGTSCKDDDYQSDRSFRACSSGGMEALQASTPSIAPYVMGFRDVRDDILDPEHGVAGVGLLKHLLEQAMVAHVEPSVALVALGRFTHEGDNAIEAMRMAGLVLSGFWATGGTVQISRPASWATLFGPEAQRV